ncbi:MAG: hypothetical protein IKY92_01770 [Akkermansia sp.]|nr:hypothetical protein [Akkermansia sp.]
MSPRVTFLLTLAGVILVGIPLPMLTGNNDAPAVEIRAEEAARRSVYATMRFTGQPRQLQVRLGKEEWLDVDCSQSPSEFELQLPLSGLMEIEIQGQWEDSAPHAVTLTLEPDGYETRSATEWKEEGSNKLHSVFRFTW